jgi:chromosome segregation ATPase
MSSLKLFPSQISKLAATLDGEREKVVELDKLNEEFEQEIAELKDSIKLATVNQRGNNELQEQEQEQEQEQKQHGDSKAEKEVLELELRQLQSDLATQRDLLEQKETLITQLQEALSALQTRFHSLEGEFEQESRVRQEQAQKIGWFIFSLLLLPPPPSC